MMTSKQFVSTAIDIANNYKTLYVAGCFGAPMNSANKTRYTKNNLYNMSSERSKMINSATSDTFGFDCVCLIKGILWGWNGNLEKTYGGAVYCANDVPDYNANQIFNQCTYISDNFENIIPGAVVWMQDHIGIYIGDNLVVECTPKWYNCVQITGLGNVSAKKTVAHSRVWSKWGVLPYIIYEIDEDENVLTEQRVREIVREEINKFFSERDNAELTEDWEKNWLELAKNNGITADGERPLGYLTRLEGMIMSTKALFSAKNN